MSDDHERIWLVGKPGGSYRGWTHITPSGKCTKFIRADLATAYLAAACDEIERLRAERAWQPIETAPLNKWVLLYWPHWSDLPVIGRYVRHRSRIVMHWQSDQIISDEGAAPTHWMPLPEAPR